MIWIKNYKKKMKTIIGGNKIKRKRKKNLKIKKINRNLN